MSHTISTLAEALNVMKRLPAQQREAAFRYIESLESVPETLPEIGESDLSRLAGCLSDKDATEMLAAIANAFEQVEEEMWR